MLPYQEMVFHGLISSEPLQIVGAIHHFQSTDISSILFFPADLAGLPFYEKFHDRLHHIHPEGRPYLALFTWKDLWFPPPQCGLLVTPEGIL
jgi:hypothetical protein